MCVSVSDRDRDRLFKTAVFYGTKIRKGDKVVAKPQHSQPKLPKRVPFDKIKRLFLFHFGFTFPIDR